MDNKRVKRASRITKGEIAELRKLKEQIEERLRVMEVLVKDIHEKVEKLEEILFEEDNP